jgi:hypothetical protein
MALIEHRVLRQLAKADIAIAGLKLKQVKAYSLDEDLTLRLGLVFRVLAPRNRDKMLACVAGIEAMSREESAYWLGMAMHRKNPRWVLVALRWLLQKPDLEITIALIWENHWENHHAANPLRC